MTDFAERKSSGNWARVDYDKNVWIPIPAGFAGTRWLDAAEWAYDNAGSLLLRSGLDVSKKVMKKEGQPRAEALIRGRDEIVGKAKAHKYYFHCPDYTKVPAAVFVGLWGCLGTREEAFQYYAYWGTKSANVAPVAEWFETEHLGTGIKACWSGTVDDGRPYDRVSYVFRDEEFNTDVQVWMLLLDHERFEAILPDLDDFVRAIRCTPHPKKK